MYCTGNLIWNLLVAVIVEHVCCFLIFFWIFAWIRRSMDQESFLDIFLATTYDSFRSFGFDLIREMLSFLWLVAISLEMRYLYDLTWFPEVASFGYHMNCILTALFFMNIHVAWTCSMMHMFSKWSFVSSLICLINWEPMSYGLNACHVVRFMIVRWMI